MYKALVIDDEPIIVRGLTRMIPWEKYDCELAGSAGDGREALELIRKLKPDLIFTDIYMPRMDGLLMIAALRSEFEDMEISILTGYRDFELAQKALNLGVTRFILKPSNLQELEEALRVMTAKLKKKGILPEREGEPAAEIGAGKAERTLSNSGAAGEGRPEVPMDPGGRGDGGAEKDRPAEEAPERRFLVNAALDYMEQNYGRKLMLSEVADQVYVSQWHLSKLLHQYGGKPFTELLNGIRIEKAKELLRNPAYRITDVSEMVGFQDVTHFSRVFRKITGIPANQYRNEMT